jgi:hypothetical protein
MRLMAKAVVLNGDIVNFEASFGAAVIVPVPGTITGTGTKLSSGAIVCVEGDESSVVVAGVSYIKGAFVGGVGKLTIKQLNSDQKATKLTVGGKKAILVGSKFDALFTVVTPAQQPGSPPTPDPTPTYDGKGSFVTTDMKIESA